jgi:DNA invertase Pin-like site-specific DNA recombinase
MKSDELKMRFVEMRAQGMGFEDISTELKVARSTLFRWQAEMRSSIDRQVQVERELIIDKFCVSDINRFERMCRLYRHTADELEGRTIGYPSTDRLMRTLMELDRRISHASRRPTTNTDSDGSAGESEEPSPGTMKTTAES